MVTRGTRSATVAENEKTVVSTESQSTLQAAENAARQQSAASSSGQSADDSLTPRALSSGATMDASLLDEALEPSTPAPNQPRERVPFGSFEQKLVVRQRPGFKTHWFNDKPGRVQRAHQASYTHILDESGRPVSMPVGVREGGGALIAYAMEIPKELYDEDFLRSQRKVDGIDGTIREGNLEAKPGDNRYVPKHGIKFSEGR